MPLLGGDSNSFWRFDLKLLIQTFFVVLLLRGVMILFGIYPRHIPVFDDLIGLFLEVVQWTAVSFHRLTANYMSF